MQNKGTLVPCWWECKLVQSLWKTVWRFLKTLKIELPYDPVILFPGINTKETESLSWKAVCSPAFTAAWFPVAKMRKQPKCPSIDKRVKKVGNAWTHKHTEYYVAIKKEILPLGTTCVNLEGILLSKSDKERQILCSLTYMWNLKIKIKKTGS